VPSGGAARLSYGYVNRLKRTGFGPWAPIGSGGGNSWVLLNCWDRIPMLRMHYSNNSPGDLYVLVGRPGLDPGTLGLKVLVRVMPPVLSCCAESQNGWSSPEIDGCPEIS
jgi:hypothetical protein